MDYFDKDQVENFNSIIEKAKQSGVNVGWSNICIEVGLCAILKICDIFITQVDVVNIFGELFYRRTGIEYRKNDPCIYRHLDR